VYRIWYSPDDGSLKPKHVVKTCVIYTREKLVANEAIVFYCVLFGLLYQIRMMGNECRAIGGMGTGKGNRSTRTKPSPALLCPPQIHMACPELEPGPPRWEAGD
jgi:hypothetical protein